MLRPATVEKLNPMWGISLNPTSIEEEAFEGRKSESKRQEYLRTRINFWSRAAGNLVSLESWERCADPKLKLEVLKGFPLYVGIDLASRSDLNAAAYMVKAGDRVYATADYWLPAKCERLQDDRFADAFLAWHRQNWLRLTPGTFIDYRVILRQILGTLDGHNVVGVGLDDYQANLMASEIEAAGYQVFIIQKNARNLTAATEDLVARTTDPELFQHDGNRSPPGARATWSGTTTRTPTCCRRKRSPGRRPTSTASTRWWKPTRCASTMRPASSARRRRSRPRPTPT